MQLALEMAFVIALGIGAFAATRISKSRHIAKFGAPPPGSHMRTIAWFALSSLILAVVAWWSFVAFASLLASAVLISQVVGFRSRPWGTWQQLRDGAMFACLFTAPIIVGTLWLTSGSSLQ